MIFIEKEQKTLHIPRHSATRSEETTLTLKIKHNITGREETVNDLKDYGFKTNYFAFYGLDFTEYQTGEYNYSLYKGDNLLETGLLCIVSNRKEIISYRKESNKLIYNG